MAPVAPVSGRCARSAQLQAHQPLVRRIAGRLRSRLPDHVDMDELLQAGLIGLDDAITRYADDRGASFETYAARRIEGAMLDALRSQDSLSRDARGRQRQIRAAVQRLEHALGRAPRAGEVADALGWTLAALHRSLAEAGAGGLREGDAALDDAEDGAGAGDAPESLDETADPLGQLQRQQRRLALHRAFDALEVRERAIMEMIYDRDLTLQQVGSELGVSTARAWQLHEAIVGKLRQRLSGC